MRGVGVDRETRRIEKSGQKGREEDIRVLSQTLTRALIAIRNEARTFVVTLRGDTH